MKLSDNFDLDEFITSTTATRKNIDNTPGSLEVIYLKLLCIHVLQPLHDAINKPIKITSGFRCLELNKAVGGSNKSAHTQGRAADIQVAGMSPKEVAQAIVDLHLPFDQVIQEFGEWCHVAVAEEVGKPRRQVLTAKKVDGKTVYVEGLV